VDEAGLVEQRTTGLETHEEVDITACMLVTPSHRTDQTDALGTVSTSDPLHVRSYLREPLTSVVGLPGQCCRTSTSGKSAKPVASAVSTIRRVDTAVAAMIRSCAPRGLPDRRTATSNWTWARATLRS